MHRQHEREFNDIIDQSILTPGEFKYLIEESSKLFKDMQAARRLNFYSAKAKLKTRLKKLPKALLS